MGSDISSNYDSVSPIFIAGFWRVHSAIHKTTGESISLWVLDQQILQTKCKKQEEIDNYINSCIYSIQQIKKLHHPLILKISESIENPKQLAFSAEPVDSCLINECQLQSDEVEYIASQLVSAIDFLHHNAGISHLNLSPNSIVLTKSFSLKLCGFNYSCSITGEVGKVFPRFNSWTNNSTLPDLNFSAPEMITNKIMTSSCDIFSFGCVIASAYLKRHLFSFTTVNEMIQTLSGGILIRATEANDSMCRILTRCIRIKPEERPTIDEIENSDALNSLQIKVYKYLDNILTKSQAEKFNFFKSLLQSLNIFSPRMLRFKFLPILMNETLSDGRFAPVTIPLVFQIGSNFDRREFMNHIYQPLSHLMTLTKPPEITLAIFSVMKILIDRIESDRHIDFIYPIYNAAFQSTEPRLHSAAVTYLPLIIKTLTTHSLKMTVIPKLNEFLKTQQNPTTISDCILSLGECAHRIDHDTFTELLFPTFTNVWRMSPSQIVADALIDVIEQVRPNVDTKMRYIIPLVSSILADKIVDVQSQVKLIQSAQSTFSQFINERNLSPYINSTVTVPLPNQQQETKEKNQQRQKDLTTQQQVLKEQRNVQQQQVLREPRNVQQQQVLREQRNVQQQQDVLREPRNGQQDNVIQSERVHVESNSSSSSLFQNFKLSPSRNNEKQSPKPSNKPRPVVLPKHEVNQPQIISAQQQQQVQVQHQKIERPKPVKNEYDYSDEENEIDQAIADAVSIDRDRARKGPTKVGYVPKRGLRYYNT